MQYVENNQEKYDTYLVLYNKLKHAMTREFYLESILITYAIFEDRSKSILAHLAIYDEKKHRDLTRKIVSINNLIEQKHKIVSKYLNPDIIEKIGVWRQKRNKIIHRLANLKYDDEEIKKIAIDGYEIVKIFLMQQLQSGEKYKVYPYKI